MSDTASTTLYLRKCSLVVANAAGSGIELSQLRVRFEIQGMIAGTPQILTARVYNLADNTVHQIREEFTQVVLQAGYEGNFGTLFSGSITQLRFGRENATDTFVDIFAADFDVAHNWGVINTSIAAGYTSDDVFNAVRKVYTGYGVKFDQDTPDFKAQPAPRGKVMFGMARDTMDALGKKEDMTWHVEQGQFHMLAYSAYKPGDAIRLDVDTGLIGVPQQTIDGIQATCLLNPSIGPGSRVQINQRLISQYAWQNQFSGPNPKVVNPAAPLDKDRGGGAGFYKVLIVNHVGDTRGNEWYTNFNCIALDPSGPPGGGVALQTAKAIQAGP